MKIENIQLGRIPAILWGEESTSLMIAVHGNLSSKSDLPIEILAEEATSLGYQVLSFDLPEHGDRKNDPTCCKVQICVSELGAVLDFAKTRATTLSLMANSMGAYFSLLAYPEYGFRQALFLSPVVNMQRIIENMMLWFEITEEQLCREQEISTPIGQTLYWDYYQYVTQHPIQRWDVPTAILYGENDTLCERDIVLPFAERFHCALDIAPQAEHYFHTESELKLYRSWLQENILNFKSE